MIEPTSPPDPITSSAVFVDFDNVFIGLRNLDPRAAETFAADPARWLGWIEAGMPGREAPRVGELGSRRVLIRRCYLNPVSFAVHRPFFIRAGFSVIDCPPLTGQGKTSTDIHMVMDILDTLAQYKHVSEYIVLSGDADFTPVLLRLRAHDRRTVVLPVGPAAAAYRAAADRVLAENDFVEVGLGFGQPADPVQPAAVGSTGAQEATSPSGGDIQLRAAIVSEVQRIVAGADGPLALARVAHDVRAVFGSEIDGTDWGGAGSFKGLLRGEQELGLQMTAGAGVIFDPARHQAPVDSLPDRLSSMEPALARVVSRIANLTGAPVLSADQHAAVFQALAEHLAEHPYEIASTSKTVRDVCNARGATISRGAVNFILKGIAYRGGFTREPPIRAADLASVHADNVLSLAAAAQLVLADEEAALARQWLTGTLS